MFRPLVPYQVPLYKDIGDWYAPITPIVGTSIGDPYYMLACVGAPLLWDITPEVDLPNVIGRTKETNIFTLDKLYSPLNKAFSSTVSIGATGENQTLASVAGLVIGDTLFFPKNNSYVQITGIAGNVVTLSTSVTASTNDQVYIPQVLDTWGFIMRTPGSQLYGGIWMVEGNPQVFEHFMPHQAVLLKRGNAQRGMPLS